MQSVLKPASKSADVNAKIIANLDALNAAHLEQKPLYFAKGLPFYTCIDSANDTYTKETKDGHVFLVKRKFDFVKDLAEDILIEKIR